MNSDRDDQMSLEDRLADALAVYDEMLSPAGDVAAVGGEAIDPELLPDLQKAEAFLWLLHQIWPPGGGVAHYPANTSGAPGQAGPADGKETTSFGRFFILRTLGHGGFGVVFQAWDPAMRRTVALMVPQPEALLAPDVRRRFLREAQAAAGLDHPNIVPVYEIGEVGSISYIVSAYCEGTTLADWLARHEELVSPLEAARLLGTLADAVQHAHDRGILHLDLKPSNFLLQRPAFCNGPGADSDRPASGSIDSSDNLADLIPRITDFSLAKIIGLEGDLTKSGVPFGTPPYMAPEQVRGRSGAFSPATDVFALGCVLYEMLCKRTPFQGETPLDSVEGVGFSHEGALLATGGLDHIVRLW